MSFEESYRELTDAYYERAERIAGALNEISVEENDLTEVKKAFFGKLLPFYDALKKESERESVEGIAAEILSRELESLLGELTREKTVDGVLNRVDLFKDDLTNGRFLDSAFKNVHYLEKLELVSSSSPEL